MYCESGPVPSFGPTFVSSILISASWGSLSLLHLYPHHTQLIYEGAILEKFRTLPKVTQLVGCWDWNLGGPTPERLLLIAVFVLLSSNHGPSKLKVKGRLSSHSPASRPVWEALVFRIKLGSQVGSQGSPWLYCAPALCSHPGHTGLFPLLQVPHAHSCLDCLFCLMLPAFLVVSAGCNPRPSRLGTSLRHLSQTCTPGRGFPPPHFHSIWFILSTVWQADVSHL